MPLIRILATVLFVIAVPVALVTTNIRFVTNEERVYSYAIDHFDGVERTGLAREELMRASAEIRDYFKNDVPVLDIRVRDGDQTVSLFNVRETAHMVDVKDRFRTVSRAQEISTVYVLAYTTVAVIWVRAFSPRFLARQVALGAGICLGVIFLMVIISLVGFDQAWEDFHELMFSNDFWLLNPATDRLIQMFPPPFWERIVFILGVLIAVQAAILTVAAGLYGGIKPPRWPGRGASASEPEPEPARQPDVPLRF